MSDNQLSFFARELGRAGGSVSTPQKAEAARSNGALGGRPVSCVVNDDGVSIKGCSFIYAPAGQAGEYAPLASNPYRGCGHACAYCYVPDVLRMRRSDFDASAELRPGFLDNLRKDAR